VIRPIFLDLNNYIVGTKFFAVRFTIGFFIFYFFCGFHRSSAQNEAELLGTWYGQLNDSTRVFDYILIVEKVKDRIFFGTTYSNGENFYCETGVRGSISKQRIQIIEEKIRNTNFAQKKELCLLSFFLTLEHDRLNGKFIPRNNFSTCRGGTVIFRKKSGQKEPVKA
jgi:hypothetical protein